LLKKLLVRVARQSPALIVAMLALFVALTGTAVATTSALIGSAQIRNNSITGLDVKNRSLRPIDFRGSVRGPRGLRGLTGATGAPGAPGAAGAKGDKGDKGDAGPGARWVLVASDGSIVSQSGGFTVANHGSTGHYYIETGAPTADKAVVVSSTWLQNAGGAANIDKCGSGTVPGGITCSAIGNTTTSVFVETNNEAGAVADARFYVVVM
jgi:hypothetical protein